MDFISILLIAVALAMDAFAVSVVAGCINKSFRAKEYLKVAFFFGFSQGLFLLAGYTAGTFFYDIISSFASYVAFALLVFIGLRMFWEGLKEQRAQNIDTKKLLVIIALAVAVSIDALAVGFSFAFLEVSIWLPIAVISLVAFLFTLVGLFLGCRFHKVLGRKAYFIGGIILIGIGFKILIENLL